jgi:hypothetical protein
VSAAAWLQLQLCVVLVGICLLQSSQLQQALPIGVGAAGGGVAQGQTVAWSARSVASGSGARLLL